MKKRITALLTAILCLNSTSLALSANAVDIEVDLDVVYSITTDTFAYTNNNHYSMQEGFFLETELAEPDLMVVGMDYYEKDSEAWCDYIVTPINDVMYGLGRVTHTVAVDQLGDQKLEVGDLLQFDGDVGMADVYPTYYVPLEGCTMTCLGNGVDIFGEEFERVIRLQMVIDQAAHEKAAAESGYIYSFDLFKGDVTVDDALTIADCLAINKNLLAGAPLCDYAKLAGDINQNGILDASDSLDILKESLGITENFE